VSALITDEASSPAPERTTDIEALQLHIGVRYLLLAPLYGYSLRELDVPSSGSGSTITVQYEGVEQVLELDAFRARLRTHVREELDRASQGGQRGAIELSRVADAEEAAKRGDHIRVLELLGAWPAPLAIFLRTPDGQLLGADARGTIARGLGLLGSACISLGEVEKGEEVLRLAVQYAGDGVAAADIYLRLGQAIQDDARPGEAIALLRRAANLGAPPEVVWPRLAGAFKERGRWVAALAACEEARDAGVPEDRIRPLEAEIRDKLGMAYQAWSRIRASAIG
jgi:tetratricopeptide (TPR) repeat protein